jgi:hypothetical protein
MLKAELAFKFSKNQKEILSLKKAMTLCLCPSSKP